MFAISHIYFTGPCDNYWSCLSACDLSIVPHLWLTVHGGCFLFKCSHSRAAWYYDYIIHFFTTRYTLQQNVMILCLHIKQPGKQTRSCGTTLCMMCTLEAQWIPDRLPHGVMDVVILPQTLETFLQISKSCHDIIISCCAALMPIITPHPHPHIHSSIAVEWSTTQTGWASCHSLHESPGHAVLIGQRMIKLGAKTLSQRQVNVHHSMTHACMSFYIYVLGYVPSIVLGYVPSIVSGCTMVSPLGHQWWYCRVVLWVISCSTAVSPFRDQWWYRVNPH